MSVKEKKNILLSIITKTVAVKLSFFVFCLYYVCNIFLGE